MEGYTPKPMEEYLHFKGGHYRILHLAQMEETGQTLVIYQALYGEEKIYARTLENFTSRVDRDKYPFAQQTFRFEKIEQPAKEKQEEEEVFPDMPKEQEEPACSLIGDAVSSAKTNPKEAPEKEETCAPSCADPPLDPFVEAFLDAQSASDKLGVLTRARGKVTDEMIDMMAIACGVEIEPGEITDRYEDLRECLITIARYEQDRTRLRG